MKIICTWDPGYSYIIRLLPMAVVETAVPGVKHLHCTKLMLLYHILNFIYFTGCLHLFNVWGLGPWPPGLDCSLLGSRRKHRSTTGDDSL